VIIIIQAISARTAATRGTAIRTIAIIAAVRNCCGAGSNRRIAIYSIWISPNCNTSAFWPITVTAAKCAVVR